MTGPGRGPTDGASALATLPGRLRELARNQGAEVALRAKRRGIWHETTWAGYYEQVRRVAHGLLDAGVRPGQHVAIVSENRPEWLIADLAVQSLGARSVGVYPTSSADEAAFLLSDAGCEVVFCEDQEQLDKVLQRRHELSCLRRVVVIDPRGTRDYPERALVSWDTFVERGAELAAERPDAIDAAIEALDPDAPAMVVYTSGASGDPRGALLTHRNVTIAGDAVSEVLGLDRSDFSLSYLPLSHIGEKTMSLYLPLTVGMTVHMGQSMDTLATDLPEVSPTVFIAVPRIWEKLHAATTARMQDASFLKRRLYAFWVRHGERIARRRLAGELRLIDKLLWAVGDLVLYRPLLERLGLRRCRVAVSGAAPIAPEILWWLHGIGVPVLECYGLTESSSVSHINAPGATRIGTVGRAIPGVACRIADDGEILLAGGQIFHGYLNDVEATRAVLDADGWLHTGDLGSVDEAGYYTVTGRKKDIIITAGGKNLSPEHIENALKVSPYIREAVALGDRRRFVSALIQIDADNVGRWASRRSMPYTSYTDLIGRSEVQHLIELEVERANRALARVAQVKRFRLLPKELHHDDEELTATQKVRRRHVEVAYRALIEEMYR